MKQTLLLIALFPAFCFSQNYQTIYPDKVAYFQAADSISVIYPFFIYEYPDNQWIRAIDMTELETSDDYTIFSNYPEINDEDYSLYSWWEVCFFDDQDSWIGKEIILFDNGMNVFLNRDGDSIFINTQSDLGDSFTFYTYNDDSYFLATVTIVESIDFLGLTDMAKTFELQFYNSNNEPAYSIHNGKQLIITENYGFYQTINFRDFPDFGENTYKAYEHVLVGLSDPEVGYKNLTYGDIYDYNPGDEFHVYDYADASGDGFVRWSIFTVISKNTISTTSVEYQIEFNWWKYAPSGFSSGSDTLINTYNSLDQMIAAAHPYELMHENGIFDTTSIYHLAAINNYNNREYILVSDATFLWYDSSNCFGLPFEVYDWHFDHYIKGCGSFFYSEANWGSGNVYTGSNLLYFKKGNEEWGTAYTPPTIGVNEIDLTENVILYPNPASDKLSVVMDKQLKAKEITIYNPSGQIILQKQTPINSIDISSLQTGLYFVEVETEEGNVRRKLIVE